MSDNRRRWDYTKVRMMSSQADSDDPLAASFVNVWWEVELVATNYQYGDHELARVGGECTSFTTFEAVIAILDPLDWDLVTQAVLAYDDNGPVYIEYWFRRPMESTSRFLEEREHQLKLDRHRRSTNLN